MTVYSHTMPSGRVGNGHLRALSPIAVHDRIVLALATASIFLTAVGVQTPLGLVNLQILVFGWVLLVSVVNSGVILFKADSGAALGSALILLGGTAGLILRFDSTQLLEGLPDLLSIVFAAAMIVYVGYLVRRYGTVVVSYVLDVFFVCAYVAAIVAIAQGIGWLFLGPGSFMNFSFFDQLAGRTIWWNGGQVGPFYRVNSFLSEPADLARALALPAVFSLMSVKSRLVARLPFCQTAVLSAFAMTFSVVGFVTVGIALIFKIYLERRVAPRTAIILGALSLVSLFILFGLGDDYILVKVQSIGNLFDLSWISTQSISAAQLSSLALAGGVATAVENLQHSILFGGGFGGHYTTFLQTTIFDFSRLNVGDLNAKDAGSLFLRVLSETGVIGILGLCSIFFACFGPKLTRFVARDPVATTMLAAIFGIFFIYLVRNGHYNAMNLWLPIAIAAAYMRMVRSQFNTSHNKPILRLRLRRRSVPELNGTI